MKNRTFRIIFALIHTLAIFVFLSVFYWGHIKNAEFGSIFIYSWDFVGNSIGVPGGFGKLVLDFITQFYHIPALGAAMLSLLLLLDSLLVSRLCRKETTLSFILSFLPSTVIFAYICHFGFTQSTVLPAVILAGSLLAARIFRKAPAAVCAIAVPAVFYLFGPLSLVFVPAVAVNRRNIAGLVAGLSAYAVCAVLSYLLYCPLVLSALFDIQVPAAIDYKSDLVPRVLPLLLAAGCILLPAFEEIVPLLYRIVSVALVYGLLSASFVFFSKASVERVLRYDALLQKKEWNRILKMSGKKSPQYFEEVCCTDLALAMKGKLADELFNFPQGGPMAMVPTFSNSISPLYTAEVLKQLKLFPPAQRFVFEAQVGGNVAEANARCYKLLAELNAALGFRAVARKYADCLSRTLFYHRWAEKFIDDDRQACLSDNLKYNLFYYDGSFADAVAYCLKSNPDNILAREYMLCWFILANDLDAFAGNFDPQDYITVPRLYQEAYALYWAQSHDDFSCIPSFVSKDVVNDLLKFANMRSKGQEAVRKKFGKTCWYYIFYTSARVK